MRRRAVPVRAKKILVENIDWGSIHPVEEILVWVEAGEKLDLTPVGCSVSMDCSIRLVYGAQEMRSPSRVCDFWHSLSDPFRLMFNTTCYGDIRATLFGTHDLTESFFFEDGVRLFRNLSLVSSM